MELIGSILKNITINKISEADEKKIQLREQRCISENTKYIWVDLNLEKMPNVFFIGTEEEKAKIEQYIFKNKTPLYLVVQENVESKKIFGIIPNSVYGLLTSFDQDVTQVVWCSLYKETLKQGCCPKKIMIPMSDFPKIMKVDKQGDLYDRIEKSCERISSFEIFQKEFITIKQDNKKCEIYDKNYLKLFYFLGVHKEIIDKKVVKHYVEIEIPDWIKENISNLYLTSIDIDKYFSLKKGRTRSLFKLLELIRYKKQIKISYNKIKKELWIKDDEKPRTVRRILKRCFSSLKEENYVEDFLFDEYSVGIIFSEVKSKSTPFKKENNCSEYIEKMAKEIALENEDMSSIDYYKNIIMKYPEEIIYKCRSLTKEIIQTSKKPIEKKGAMFCCVLKKEVERIDKKEIKAINIDETKINKFNIGEQELAIEEEASQLFKYVESLPKNQKEAYKIKINEIDALNENMKILIYFRRNEKEKLREILKIN